MAPPSPSDSDLDEELRALIPKRRLPVVPIVMALFVLAGAIGVLVLYDHLPQRGLTISGEGYIIVPPGADAWVLLAQGTLVQASSESVNRLHARTGPCHLIQGSMLDPLPQLELEHLECTPGAPLVPAVVTRLHWLGAKFGYWADGVEPHGDSLEAALERSPEVVAAMIDPRANDPQILPLYTPLYPASLQAARRKGLPPPVLISVRRNDLLIVRLREKELADFLQRDALVFAGAAAAGGWLVRDVMITPEGAPTLERLLVAPEEPPWPALMKDRTLRVSRRKQLGERTAGQPQTSQERGESTQNAP
jgi:hypothetical protein